mmetsp:Transcript_47751/g.153084  ORF Transcript_47751/g.153084 Transcript_47751/m.153084 type:complete len:234 (-) Transcript_47751:124-825(-)
MLHGETHHLEQQSAHPGDFLLLPRLRRVHCGGQGLRKAPYARAGGLGDEQLGGREAGGGRGDLARHLIADIQERAQDVPDLRRPRVAEERPPRVALDVPREGHRGAEPHPCVAVAHHHLGETRDDLEANALRGEVPAEDAAEHLGGDLAGRAAKGAHHARGPLGALGEDEAPRQGIQAGGLVVGMQQPLPPHVVAREHAERPHRVPEQLRLQLLGGCLGLAAPFIEVGAGRPQ